LKLSLHYKLILLLLISLLSNLCTKDKDNLYKVTISGYAQKGPFITGTPVFMNSLNSDLTPYENSISFDTLVSSNSGFYKFTGIELSSQYIEVYVDGSYFSEIGSGGFTLSLYALADIKNTSTVNINVLTTLERFRVPYLKYHGNSFSMAKAIAQKEILAIFGYHVQNINHSEMLDISLNKEENAILLAISIIFLSYTPTSQLSNLLNNIAEDIDHDGTLNDTSILSQLRSTTQLLDLSRIRSNLEAKYRQLGITTVIPNFEKYINDFLSFTGS
jgi:hypothetical protein